MKRMIPALLVLAGVAAANEDLAPRLRAALVKLRVESQPYDATSPWNKRNPARREGRGVVISEGVVLTPAANVRDHLMIEVSVANSARRFPARLKHVDPRIGLALVEIADEELKKTLKPLEIGDPVKLDDEFDIYQLGLDNMVERYTARVVRANGSGTRLSMRLQTTCSESGNGQLALRDGKIVGLVTSTNRSRQEGTIVSVETIRHYLDDFKDGTYHGCPGPSVWIQPLLRDDLRKFYGVGADQHGIVITRVMPGRTGEGVVEPGDVLLTMDGYDLDDEGKFTHEVHGRLNASYLFQGRRYAGDSVLARVLRKGEIIEISLQLKGWPAEVQRVPDAPRGKRPRFLVVGGLVILELNKTLASSMPRSPGGVILRRYNERAGWDPADERKRIVYVDRVLADVTNKGFENLVHAPIRTVNGKTIREIGDVAAALDSPQGGFHVFRFEGLEADFVIPADKLDEIDERIARTYKVTLLRNLD